MSLAQEGWCSVLALDEKRFGIIGKLKGLGVKVFCF